jgi:uncharacterized protein YvpB
MGRRVALALLAGALLAGCGVQRSSLSTQTRSRPLRVLLPERRPFVVALRVARAAVVRLPARYIVVHGRVRTTFALRRTEAVRAVRHALAVRVAVVRVPARPVSSRIRVPVVRQVLRNDCEAASLSMLLAAAGLHVGQLELQRRLPEARPLDPVSVPGRALPVWGDPERGFVGRADGGGPGGGFGVYEPPVGALARRYGVRLVDLRGASLTRLRTQVLRGHAVLAWVGLSDGPYRTWVTPAGRQVTANFGEHAVVLVGAGPGYVDVNDPLSGTRQRWSDRTLAVRWQRLGRRALALP